MAFANASKGVPLAGLFKNLLLAVPSSSSSVVHPASSVVAARRLFSSAPFSREDSYQEFVFHGTRPMFSSTACRGWVSKHEEKAMQVKMEMPGLAAEHVKVWASPEGLMVKGEAVKDPDAADVHAQNAEWYTGRIVLPPDAFELDKAEAEMKDGVLTVTVPRVKVDIAGDSSEIKVRKG